MKRKVRRETNNDKCVFSLPEKKQDKHQPIISRNHRRTCSIQKKVRMVSTDQENADKNIHEKDL